MKKIEVFDPALCCSSGICGTEVDEALATFSADVGWFKHQGGQLDRYNLSQQPMVFAENPVVSAFLRRSGEQGLPLILLDGEIALAGRYPARSDLVQWSGINAPAQQGRTESAHTESTSTCCGSGGCC